MKKCKLTIQDSAEKTKYFYLFPESALLHTLAKKSTSKNLKNLLKNHPLVEVVTLKKDQWIEAEWNGCDISYENGQCISTSFLRLVRATYKAKRVDNALLSVHFGWIFSDQIKMIDRVHDGIKTEILTEKDAQFDFSELFQDNETTEDLIKKQALQEIM